MIKKILGLLGVLLLSASASFAQRYDGIAISYKGTPVPFAAVAVCTQPAVTTTAPCTPRATLYTDLTLSVVAPNPLTSDAYGNYHFYVNPIDGPFTVQAYGSTITTPIVLTDQMPNGGISASTAGTLNTLPKWTSSTTLGNSCASDTGTTFTISCTNASANTLSLNNPLAILSGGNGTSTPALTAGLNMSLTGTWPDYTVGTLSDVVFNTVTANEVDATTINSTSITNLSGGTNGLVSGGGIFWLSGLTYAVAKTTVSIGGQLYTAPQTNVTLAAADPSNPRFDTFFTDINSTTSDITGTPAPSPVTPQVDPTTQWSLGFVSVTAGETAPPITNLTVYDENTGPPSEWACSTSGVGWNCADTSHPDSGTFDISADGSSATSYVKLTAASATDLSTYNVLKLRLYTVSAWSGKNEVWLSFYNGTTAVGSAVFTSINNFGFDGTATGAYQYVIIPMSAFNLGSNQVDSMRILWNTGGKTATGKTIYLDNIQLQANGVTGGSGGSGSVTSVCMSGDGLIYNSTVPGSCITTSGTLAPTVASTSAGFFLAGPVGNSGSNVFFRQAVKCEIANGVASSTCVMTNVQSGDFLAISIVGSSDGSFSFLTAMSDSLGSTFTSHGGSSSANYWTAVLAGSGSDTITYTRFSATGAGSFYIIELGGVNSFSAATSVDDGQHSFSAAYNKTNTITPSAATDSVLNVLVSGSTCTSVSGMQLNPTSPFLTSYTATNSSSTMSAWLSAPGSTSSVNYTFSGTVVGCSANYVAMSLDFIQSATSSTSPWTARRIQESDLPSTAVSAIQSVNVYNLASNFAVTAGSDNTVFSQTITMPPDGGPFRVLCQYGLFLKAGSSAMPWDVWMSDGTNVFNGWEMETTDATKPSANSSALSPVSYTNNQAVTFTVHVETDAGATSVFVFKNATAGGAESFLSLSVVQSKN